jgi:hypothetical protein
MAGSSPLQAAWSKCMEAGYPKKAVCKRDSFFRQAVLGGWWTINDGNRIKAGRIGRPHKRNAALALPDLRLALYPSMPPACARPRGDETHDGRPGKTAPVRLLHPGSDLGPIGRIHPAHVVTPVLHETVLLWGAKP